MLKWISLILMGCIFWFCKNLLSMDSIHLLPEHPKNVPSPKNLCFDQLCVHIHIHSCTDGLAVFEATMEVLKKPETLRTRN